MSLPAAFEIGGKPVGPGHPVYVIAEAGANHNRDLDVAHGVQGHALHIAPTVGNLRIGERQERAEAVRSGLVMGEAEGEGAGVERPLHAAAEIDEVPARRPAHVLVREARQGGEVA